MDALPSTFGDHMDGIRIDQKLITIKDASAFARLVNDLLCAEAWKAGIPQEKLDTTMQVSARDEGIDARVTPQDSHSSEWIPSDRSTWQYKSGKCPSATKLASKELTKPGVVAAIESGEPYCFVTGDDITAPKRDRLLEAINREYEARGHDPLGRVYAASHLAAWAAEHPAVAVEHLQLPLQNWMSHRKWSSLAPFQTEYVPDPERAALIEDVRSGIEAGNPKIRVVGHAGMGKTRVVLEALRHDGIEQDVLYLPDAADFNPRLFWHLGEQEGGATAIFVVDEVSSDQWQKIVGAAGILPSTCSVIGIGPTEYGATQGTLALGQMGTEELAELLEQFAPGFPEGTRRAIAERCGGSPKLVVLYGRVLADMAGGGWEQVERSVDVVEYLNTRVFPAGAQASPRSLTMRGISLFVGLGWFGELDGEMLSVVEFMGVAPAQARDAALQLIDDGVVSRRGRLLYPTPDVLANYLARKTLESRPREQLKAMIESLSERAQESFAHRMRQLGEDPITQSVVEEVFGDPVFFTRLNDLNDARLARQVRLLAPAYPGVWLDRLTRLIGDASRDELRRFTQGRREIVWALQELAWWPEHFAKAARAMRQLASAETEDYANNATGVWAEFFRIVLGGTGTPFRERLPVLKESLQSDDEEIRRLGVLALGQALQTQLISRTGGPPHDAGRPAPKEWIPSRQEWRGLLREELVPLLKEPFSDPSPVVRSTALEVLERRGSDLFAVGLAREWAKHAASFTDAPYAERRGLLRFLTVRLRHSDDLDDALRSDLRDLLQRLAGSSFSDRLKRATAPWDYQTFGESGERQEMLKDLVSEIIENPEHLWEEIEWIYGGEANSAYELARLVGEKDEELDLLSGLLQRKTEDSDERFITGYLNGAADHHGTDWLESLLDQWARDDQHHDLIAATTWRCLRTSRAAARLARLFKEGKVPAEFVSNLAAGFWARELPPSRLREVIDASGVSGTPRAVSGRLWVLEQYLGEHPEALSELRDLAMKVLAESAGVRATAMDAYHWKNLAKALLDHAPLAIAAMAVEAAKSDEVGGAADELREVLSEAIDRSGWAVFQQVIGPAAVQQPFLLWRLDTVFEGRSLLGQFEPSQLISWIEENREERLVLVSHAAPVGGPDLSPLARALLRRYEAAEVGGELAATFGTGSFWGPESLHLESKIRQLEEWAQDEEREVRSWASKLLSSYRKQLKVARQREEETGEV